MKKLLHNITLRVILKEEGEVENMLAFFREILPVDHKKCRIDVLHEKTRGFDDVTLHILSMKLHRRRMMELLLTTLFSRLSEGDRKKIASSSRSMMDEFGAFFLRLDRAALLHNEKKFILTDGGDCVHFRIKLAAFPRNEKNLSESLKEVLERCGNIAPHPIFSH